MKGKCPNIDPCGMPLKISLQSLNVEFILIYCVFFYLRTFLIKLINEIKHVRSCVVFENHTKFLWKKGSKYFDVCSYITLSQSFDASNSFSIEWVFIFVFLYIELIFAHFRHFRENVRCQCCIYTCCDSVENKITFFKKISWNFCRKIIYDSFYGLCGHRTKWEFTF